MSGWERKLIRNEWTGTHHVHDGCRGMRASEAPNVEVMVPWAEMPNTKLCGFCCPGGKLKEEEES